MLSTGLLIAATAVCAQQGPPKSPSPTASADIAGKRHHHHLQLTRRECTGRHLFTKDGLIGHDPTYPVWRAGANAATKLHTDSDLSIGSLLVPQGRLTFLYVDISDPANWVLAVNKQSLQWGTKYDKSQGIQGRALMIMSKPPALVENLEYTLSPTLEAARGSLPLAWEWHSGFRSLLHVHRDLRRALHLGALWAP